MISEKQLYDYLNNQIKNNQIEIKNIKFDIHPTWEYNQSPDLVLLISFDLTFLHCNTSISIPIPIEVEKIGWQKDGLGACEDIKKFTCPEDYYSHRFYEEFLLKLPFIVISEEEFNDKFKGKMNVEFDVFQKASIFYE